MKVVVLPGLDGTGCLVDEFTRLLSEKHEPILFKYPERVARYDVLLDWITERLPCDDYVIVAESFSGPLAVMIAARKPKALNAIIFVATFAKSPRRVPNALAHLVRILPIRNMGLLWLAQPFLIGAWATKKHLRKIQAALFLVPKQTLSARLGQVLATNVVEGLRDLKLPMLYITALQDRLVPLRAAIDFQACGVDVIGIDGPHFLLQVKPNDAVLEVNKFIQNRC
jgi:pimeloyl-[acyl-carrier protein] methyl ester esterase